MKNFHKEGGGGGHHFVKVFHKILVFFSNDGFPYIELKNFLKLFCFLIKSLQNKLSIIVGVKECCQNAFLLGGNCNFRPNHG